MIIIEGTIRVPDLDVARPHMEAIVHASRAEAGFVEYAYAQDLLDPTLFRVIELWTKSGFARSAPSLSAY